MPLDPRSRERLEALGRTLPVPLPAPEPVSPRRAAAEAPRHAVETEEDPDQLFRELMAASTDGTVPPHLLDRLRQLEAQRRGGRSASPAPAGSVPQGRQLAGPTAAGPAPRRGSPPRSAGRARRATAAGEEAELYTAFAQLLLEDEELD